MWMGSQNQTYGASMALLTLLKAEDPFGLHCCLNHTFRNKGRKGGTDDGLPPASERCTEVECGPSPLCQPSLTPS